MPPGKIITTSLLLISIFLIISPCHANTIESPTDAQPPDYTSITLVNNSISGFTYIPWGTKFEEKNLRLLTNDGELSNAPQLPTHIEVPSGSTISQSSPENIVVTYNKNKIIELNYLPHNQRLLAGEITPINDWWVLWATMLPQNLKSNDQITAFSAQWNVPNSPTEINSPIYIFNGIQTKDNVKLPEGYIGGIIQPILMFNCGGINTETNTCTGLPKSGRWTGAAVHDPPYDPPNPQKPDIMSEQIPVAQTDTVQGTMMWNPIQQKWTVIFTNINTGISTYIDVYNKIPPNNKYTEPVFAYESRSTQIERYRTWGDITFSKITLSKGVGLLVENVKSNIETGYNNKTITEGKSTYDKNNYYVDTKNWPSTIKFQIPKPEQKNE